MKKFLCVLMCLTLALSAALAEETQRTRTVQIAGDGEEITETLFESDYGYKMWYDAKAFKPVSPEGEGFDEFAPVDPDALMPLSLTIVEAEITADEADELLDEIAADNREGGWAMAEIVKALMDDGGKCRVCEGVKDGVMMRLYQITLDERTYCVTATFPEEAAEGYGARLDIMIKTIEG